MFIKFLFSAITFTIFSSILINAVPINYNVNLYEKRVAPFQALTALGTLPMISGMIPSAVGVNKRALNLPVLAALGAGAGHSTVPVIATLATTTEPGLLNVLPFAAFPGAIQGLPALALLAPGAISK
ncbi:5970_t:CDS:1 [Ambispora leptoticha]|uniref:5970_t:CDS:1 n=1 Tax=Ambispora leptoticha TaxID=144679 RepID=A0A9N8WKP9_9GLOM|nr:5970_t:CDS:1 [Ambispora leptoticha]